jgi:phage tail-like protein
VADELLQAFRFRVSLTLSASTGPASHPSNPERPSADKQRLGDGGFQECGGLDLETDVREYLEGGRNDGVIRRVGRVKLQPLVLKRGMLFADPDGPVRPELWAWIQDTVAGRLPIRRYDGIVEVTRAATDSATMATWRFVRGLPLKVTGPSLNAKTGEIAIEELHIAHEGLQLVTGADR